MPVSCTPDCSGTQKLCASSEMVMVDGFSSTPAIPASCRHEATANSHWPAVLATGTASGAIGGGPGE